MPDPILIPAPRHAKWGEPRGAAARSDVTESIDASIAPHSQGYRLQIDDNSIHLTGADAAGLFYGRQTLAQLRRQFTDHLPQGLIDDWPDFPARGFMLDISRDKVPTMSTLFMLVDMFAELKINQLQLYTEHTFAYAQHREISSITMV